MTKFDLVGFRDHLRERDIRTGFDITYPHSVELRDRTPAMMGNERFATFLQETRQWCRENLTGEFTTKRMRTEALREVGVRFEFAAEADAAYFALRWC